MPLPDTTSIRRIGMRVRWQQNVLAEPGRFKRYRRLEFVSSEFASYPVR